MIEKMMYISVKHLPDGDPKFGGMRVIWHAFGYIAFLAGEKNEDCDIPNFMKPIVDYAIKNGCYLINFDYDAPVMDKFEILR